MSYIIKAVWNICPLIKTDKKQEFEHKSQVAVDKDYKAKNIRRNVKTQPGLCSEVHVEPLFAFQQCFCCESLAKDPLILEQPEASLSIHNLEA